jgi:hypothetical protein
MVLLLLLSMKAGAAVRWTGLSSNGLWADPGNWENGILPGAADDVLLDNSMQPAGYFVRLPDFAVSVRSLQVLPANLQTITVELPVTNLISSPTGSLLERAFTTTGIGYSFLLGKGAVFVNASGSNSGYSLRLNDSLQVSNGGMYIHRTRTGHADIVQYLSRTTGTEQGIFRFENPDAASTISLSGRVFGSLQLSAAAAVNGTVSYSASGTNAVLIRGELAIEQGVSLAINFDDTLKVQGDLVMSSAVFNMATGNRSSVLWLEGDWKQSGGAITESNLQQKTGTIIMAGSKRQTISCTGQLTDSIIIDIKNLSGVQLLQPLRCTYGLRLSTGALLSTSLQLITLAPNAWLQADSIAQKNFIDGPLKKEGLANSYFLFPVGRNGQLRWLALRNSTGDVMVEYHPASAYSISTILGAGIDHLSQLEYWSVSNSTNGTGNAELSFDGALSGGVSELVSLRVAAYSNSSWFDAGNQATTGTAFTNGSVTSGVINSLGTTTQFITLASSSSFTNVLPLYITDQWMDYTINTWNCNWKVDNDETIAAYEVALSVDGRQFEKIKNIPADHIRQYFRQVIPASWQKGFCQINAIHDNGREEAGTIMRFGYSQKGSDKLTLVYGAGSGMVQIGSDQNRKVNFELFDAAGKWYTRKNILLYKGITSIPIADKLLASGIYWIRLSDNGTVLLTKGLFVQ